jgi:hypothetical protein
MALSNRHDTGQNPLQRLQHSSAPTTGEEFVVDSISLQRYVDITLFLGIPQTFY